MPHHGRYEPGIVDLLAFDVVVHDELMPTFEDRTLVAQNPELWQEAIELKLSFFRAQTEPIRNLRTSCHGPKFINGLWDNNGLMTQRSQYLNRFDSDGILRVLPLYNPEQHVRIDEYKHA
jgi:hypothetical protein